MSLTQTTVQPEVFPKLLLKSLDAGNILKNEPAEVVDMALQELRRAGVELIEWRAELYRRMHVPIVVMVSVDSTRPKILTQINHFKDYSFLVDDDHLSRASEILSDMGLPVSKPSEFLLRTGGDFRDKGYFYRRLLLHLVLCNILCFIRFRSRLLIGRKWKGHLKFTRRLRRRGLRYAFHDKQLFYASLIRMISQTLRYCSTATKLRSDLSELIGYGLL